MPKYKGYTSPNKGAKVWLSIITVVLAVVLIVCAWLAIVYGKEIYDDSKNFVEDNFITETEKDDTTTGDEITDEENGDENTSAKIGLTLSLVDNVWTAKLL